MNMMKYCPECYKEIPPELPSCPFCGYKTENGTEDETPQILKTPKTDSYIPPEQTVLNLLLLLIFFWELILPSRFSPYSSISELQKIY